MYIHKPCGTQLEVGMIITHMFEGVKLKYHYDVFVVCEIMPNRCKVKPHHEEDTTWYPYLSESSVRIIPQYEARPIPAWIYKYLKTDLEFELVD